MDSVAAYFKGFFYMVDGGEAQQEQSLSQRSNDHPGTTVLEGRSHPDGRPHQRSMSPAPPSHRRPRALHLLWSKSEDSQTRTEVPPHQSLSSSSSSSLNEPNHRAVTSNSDTSSTQSFSEEDEGRGSSSNSNRGSSRSHQERGRSGIPRGELTDQAHIQFLSHGKAWTINGILSTWIGFTLAYLAWTSTAFVTLTDPMKIDPAWQDVTQVGMFNLKLCYNETHSGQSNCIIHRLTSDDTDDNMFQTARATAFLVILLGGFLSFFTTSALCWYSINLRPIGLGYLAAYLLQSLTFLLFDSKMCNERECSIAKGGLCSAVASLCWIWSCISVVKMDSFKYHNSVEWTQSPQSRSRSTSPHESRRHDSPIKRKVLERRTTDGTFPQSDGSIDSDDDYDDRGGRGGLDDDDEEEDVEMAIETSWRRPRNASIHGHRRFASNGCEIIQGIQDPQAHHAWNARSPSTMRSPASGQPRLSPRTCNNPSKRPNLTIDTSEANASFQHRSSMGAVTTSVPHRYNNRDVLRASSQSKRASSSSPSKRGSPARLDHSGDIQRSPLEGTRPRTTAAGTAATGGTDRSSRFSFVPNQKISFVTDDVVSTSSSSDTAQRIDVVRQLNALDTLVEQATTPRAMLSRNPASSTYCSDENHKHSSVRNGKRVGSHRNQEYSRSAANDDGPRRPSSKGRVPPSPLASRRGHPSIVFDFLED